MFCQSCGSPVQGSFCSTCGVSLQTPPASAPLPATSRVHRHLQTLGILWCVSSVLRVLSGIVASLFLKGFIQHLYLMNNNPLQNVPTIVPMLVGFTTMILVLSVISALLSLFAGVSLLMRKSWGRITAIIVASLSLIKIPLGTALGIYTLWVLMPSTSASEYAAITDHS